MNVKKKWVYSIIVVLLSVTLIGAVHYFGKVIEQMKLAVPDDPDARTYLGIKQDSGQISLADIDADIVIIEIFNMYCPHCQRHAPTANKLYQIIEADTRTRNKVKLIGIGVGNSAYEVKFFKKKYNIPFPLFDDAQSTLLNSLRGIKTPSFFGVRKNGNSMETFFMDQGPFDDAQVFLQTVLQKSGLSL